MKKCITCNVDKKFYDFGKSCNSKDGLQSKCSDCKKSYEKRYYRKTADKQRFAKRANTRKYIETKKDFKIFKKEYDKAYFLKNRKKILERCSFYSKSNPSMGLVKMNVRRARKLQAMPSWADIDKITLVYKKAKWLESITGLKYHVDHVIPLKGKNVCGLHIWENLQILEASINLSKSNK